MDSDFENKTQKSDSNLNKNSKWRESEQRFENLKKHFKALISIVSCLFKKLKSCLKLFSFIPLLVYFIYDNIIYQGKYHARQSVLYHTIAKNFLYQETKWTLTVSRCN